MRTLAPILIAIICVTAMPALAAVPATTRDAGPADAQAAREKAVASGQAGMEADMQQLNQEMTTLLNMLRDFNKSTVDQRLEAIDGMIDRIDQFRQTIAPGGEFQSAIQELISTHELHAKRRRDSTNLDPAMAQSLAKASEDRARETAELLVRVQGIHAGMAPLIAGLGRQRYLHAELDLDRSADEVVAALRAAIDKIQSMYDKLWEGVRAGSATS